MKDEEKIDEYYKTWICLLKRCVLSERKADRIKYGKQMVLFINHDKKQFLQASKAFDDMIEKLCNAAKIIHENSEWLSCLMIAMDDQKDQICHTAKLIHKGIERTKNK